MNWAAASGSSIDRGSTAASAEELSIAPSAVDLSAITRERAGHAVASGASLAELKARDPDDLEPVAHPRDRHRVAGVVPPVAMCQVGVLGVVVSGVVVSGLMVSGPMAQLHAMGA
jgi:hypothetical protein